MLPKKNRRKPQTNRKNTSENNDFFLRRNLKFRAAEKARQQTPKLTTMPQPLLLCAYPGLFPVPKMRIARHTMARLQAGPHEFLLRQYRHCRVRQRNEPGELSPVDA